MLNCATKSTGKERALQKRTMIGIDFQGLAVAFDSEPLAARAEAVSKKCERQGCGAAAEELGKPKGWISKMRCIAKAVKSRSVAGAFVLQDGVKDIEIAYYLCLVESKNRKKACEIIDNIDNETRHTVKRAWQELR